MERIHIGPAFVTDEKRVKMKFQSQFGFYGILTNPVVGYERLASLMFDRGVRFIQLRMKNASRDEVVGVARSLRTIIGPGSFFIVNDDPGIALEVGADGVHLGQDDAPYASAREMLGDEVIIGLSTHNPDQTRAACALEPDYIGVGPVFSTPTKAIPDPVIGLDGMREMLDLSTVPAVAIGGIDNSNLSKVLDAGARNVCAVRCVNGSSDPASALDRIVELIGEHRKG